MLSALCDFLGITYESGMLGFHKSDRVQRLATPGGPWENFDKPLLSGNYGKFREGLSREHLVMVETYLGGLMRRFVMNRSILVKR